MSKLITTEKNYRAYKALIASKYSGKSVSTQTVAEDKANTQFGKLPVLEVSGTSLFDSSAIAYYLSNAQLRGENELAQAQVLQWVGYADNDILPAVFAWVLPATGLSNQKQTLESAKNDLKNSLKLVNDYLLTRTYLVGEKITLADISLAVSLLPLYQYVLEPSVRQAYGNVNRWFETLVNQKEFISVVGKVELCTSVKQLSASTSKKAEPKKEAKKPEPKKQEKKKPKEEEDDAGDDLIPAEPKQKDPFEKFPKGNFDFDDFKRFYSNNPEDKSIPYFWEKFDKQNYSIWYCEYKFPQELVQDFMSCNLIGGFFQRLEKLNKNAFASVCLFDMPAGGSSISGVWVWRGHELVFPLSDNWTIDYPSYEWTKLNPDDEKTKVLVKEYFSWEGDFGGKKFNQGKIFK